MLLLRRILTVKKDTMEIPLLYFFLIYKNNEKNVNPFFIYYIISKLKY